MRADRSAAARGVSGEAGAVSHGNPAHDAPMIPRLLLLSNSRNPGGAYLAHARKAIARFLGPAAEDALFIPYAGVRIGWDEYLGRVAAALRPAGVVVRGIHRAGDAVAAVRGAGAILVGGGNTWQLLDQLYGHGLVRALRLRVLEGAPYVGWSAGSGVAAPTIRTTNDMPIVAPPSLDALGLVPFQVNAHYTEAKLPRHGGETRVDRLLEFCAVNPATPVVALREGSWLRVEEGRAVLEGPKRALVYLGEARHVVKPGDDVGPIAGVAPVGR